MHNQHRQRPFAPTLFAFTGMPFGFLLESRLTFTGIPIFQQSSGKAS